jgi:hypothetical protein
MVVPEKDWIRTIVKACWATKTPVFLKDSLKKVWGEDLIQEWPEGMPVEPAHHGARSGERRRRDE